MDIFNQIPFGLDPETNEFREVHEVERGLRCGCICPSCRTPLTAKKGEDRAWHFAHETRGTFASTTGACDYSLYVALKLLARQILGQAVSLRLPQLEISGRRGGQLRSQLVTQERSVRLSSVEIETALAGLSLDALVTVVTEKQGADASQGQVGIYLTYPGREFPIFELPDAALAGGRVGVLELDLRMAMPVYASHFQQGFRQGFKGPFQRFLLEGVEGKTWHFHPRQAPAQRRLDEELARLPESTPTPAPHHYPAYQPAPPRAERLAVDKPHLFACTACKVEWICLPTGMIHCLKCGSNHYVKKLGLANAKEFGTFSYRPWQGS